MGRQSQVSKPRELPNNNKAQPPHACGTTHHIASVVKGVNATTPTKTKTKTKTKNQVLAVTLQKDNPVSPSSSPADKDHARFPLKPDFATAPANQQQQQPLMTNRPVLAVTLQRKGDVEDPATDMWNDASVALQLSARTMAGQRTLSRLPTLGGPARAPRAPGAVRVGGQNAQHESSIVVDDQGSDAGGLVEAMPVKELQLLHAEAINVKRRRRIIAAVAVCVIGIGLALGIVLGTAVRPDRKGDPAINVHVIKPQDYREMDFTNYTVEASLCFPSTTELYQVVDDYVRLRAKIDKSADDYVSIRNESLSARDAIASKYGWPIGRFCVSNLKSLRGVFSPLRNEGLLALFNEDVSGWDTANVQSFDELFYGNSAFNQPLLGWNTSQVTSMFRMFRDSSTFDQDLSSWDTENVESMEEMFAAADAFNRDISTWDVRRVATLRSMFTRATMFNQDLSAWNLSSATTLGYMFEDARSFNQPSTCEWGLTVPRRGSLAHWVANMFATTSCPTASKLPNLFGWPITSMCADCAAYFNEKLHSSRFVGTPAPARTPFQSTTELKQAVDEYMMHRLGRVSGHDAGSIQSKLASHYGWPIGEWNVSRIEDFSFLFSIGRSPLLGVFNDDISKWDVSNGRSFASMFAGSALFNISLSGWNVSKATDLSGMFGWDKPPSSSLGIGIPMINSLQSGAASFASDISCWDVSRTTNVAWMFAGARSFNHDIDRWEMSRVETMEGMFAYMRRRITKGLSRWDVSRVRSFRSMFEGTNLTGDVSGWDVSSGADFSWMFALSRAFNQDISGWNVTSARTMRSMFSGTAFGHDVSVWKPINCVDFSLMFMASNVNHSYCDWGKYVGKPGVSSRHMFMVSHCSDVDDPDVATVPVSPLCTSCPVP